LLYLFLLSFFFLLLKSRTSARVVTPGIRSSWEDKLKKRKEKKVLQEIESQVKEAKKKEIEVIFFRI